MTPYKAPVAVMYDPNQFLPPPGAGAEGEGTSSNNAASSGFEISNTLSSTIPMAIAYNNLATGAEGPSSPMTIFTAGVSGDAAGAGGRPPATLTTAAGLAAAAAAGGDFILFPNLAPELQLMIWKEAAMHGRVVIVDHAFKKKDRASRKNIIEQYPGMLGACHQSRELVKSSYRSVFQEPGVSYRWEYAGRKTYGDLYNVAMTLFNIASEAPEDYQTLVRTLNAYMNRHPEQTNIFANFANLVQKHKGNHGTVMPAFFNPDVDIIYIRRDIGNQGQGIQNFRRGLWIPNKTMGAAKIQKLAIELDRLKCCAVESRFEEERDIRLWPSCTPFRQLSGLKEFNLVLLEDREIITFTVDDTGLLRGCEWYFSLDVKSKEFKEDIGNYWLNVTWRVTLAPQKGYNLMQLAHRWRPQNETWEWQKQEICKRDRDVEEEWHDTIRVPTFDYPQWLKGEDKGRKKNERKMKLVPNGDGKSYWGVSRKEIF